MLFKNFIEEDNDKVGLQHQGFSELRAGGAEHGFPGIEQPEKQCEDYRGNPQTDT